MQRIQHCPYSLEPKRYGTDTQSPLPSDDTQKLTDSEIKQVQKIIGSILYYARAVDMTVLMALSTIASEQMKGTERTSGKDYQVLDYLATHPNATVKFCASDMVMNIHSDASYLSKPNAHSRACGHFLWDSYQQMVNSSDLTALFIRCVRFYDLWCHQLPKQNWEHYS